MGKPLTFKDAKKLVYGTSRWRRLRAEILKREPVCQTCKVVLASQVHHKVGWWKQRRIDEELAWGVDNLEPICADCHWKKPKSNDIRCRECGNRKWAKECEFCARNI